MLLMQQIIKLLFHKNYDNLKHVTTNYTLISSTHQKQASNIWYYLAHYTAYTARSSFERRSNFT
jgi:hypothetical protein